MLRGVMPLILFGLLTSLGSPAQESHRRPNPSAPSQPNVFDQLERQTKNESRREQLARQAAERKQRQAELAQLADEVPRLIGLAHDLQERLKSTDLDTTLPIDLRQQGQKLERLAREINKRIRGL